MSDLDKAIRAELVSSYWRLSRQTSTTADKGATAITDLLDWASGLENGLDGPSAVGKAFAEQVRTVIAASLGVSGEDRSVPTPARRVWRDKRGQLWDDDGNGLLYQTASNGRRKAERSREQVERHYGPLSEVVTPEGPA